MRNSWHQSMDCGDRYEWVQQVGNGAYGVVCRMRDKLTGEMVAGKFIERGEKVDENVRREVINHLILSGHPNIVGYKEAFLTPTHLVIAMEYATDGTLFERLEKFERFSEAIARYFFQQLVRGVTWMHQQGICHRDLKLENTLLTRAPAAARGQQPGAAVTLSRIPRVALGDFGYSKSEFMGSKPDTIVGSPAYIAPEVCSGEQYDGPLADVWALGVALYTMLVGSYPFQDPDHPHNCSKMIQRIMAVQYELPPDIPLSPDCVDLISRILVADPEQRITLQEIRRHPWFLVSLPLECQDGMQPLLYEPPQQSEREIVELLAAAASHGTARSHTHADRHLEHEEHREW